MDLIIGIILGVFVLTILVAIHEFGHGIIARRNGVKVEEFGIGFPPKAKGKKIASSILGKNVEYSLNWLPLGGFVRLKGEHDDAEGKGTYGSATFWQKTKILLAGVTVNWLAAVVLFTLLALVGLPKLTKVLPNQFTVAGDTTVINKPVQVDQVVSGLPADLAGLRTGDTIIRFNGQKIDSSDDLATAIKQNAGKSATFIYSRNNIEHQVTTDVRAENKDGKGYIGAGLSQQQVLRSTWSAPIVGVMTTAQLTLATLQGLGDTLVKAVTGFFGQFSFNQQTRSDASKNLGEAGRNVAGPIGIFGIIFPAAEKGGPVQVLLLTAILSLTLAVINVLPIPGLDGGRWFLTAIFKVLKKPLTEETESKINGIGMLVLVGLIVLVTIADVGKLAG